MAQQEEMRVALFRQRRFLILMSLAVIAFVVFEAGVGTEAEYSGAAVTLGRPDRVIYAVWIVWLWAFLRYLQRVYEQFSILRDEILEDVFAEDMRLALIRARHHGNRLAASDHWQDVPRSARVRDYVRVGPLDAAEWGEEVEPPDNFRGFTVARNGRRRYPTLAATFDWPDEDGGSIELTFQMELSRNEVRWLRLRAWLHSAVRLPGISEHIGPAMIAVGALAAIVVYWATDPVVVENACTIDLLWRRCL